MRIVVAMSGGVDSSTAAALLVEQGHEVIGVAMKTHNLAPRANRACCTPDDMRDARRVAQQLGIPFYVINYADLFEEQVIRPFAEAYRDGRTPNPCVECNDKVKFRPLLERANLLKADRLATGHYARVESHEQGYALHRGVDAQKDQSYFLYRLDNAQLAQLMFPVGSMRKEEVRAHAQRLGLGCAQKQESQEICFVGDEGYASTVESILGAGGKSGRFVASDGSVLGEHRGIHRYTVGQRRGLGLSAANPLYVTHVDAITGDVHVGGKDEVLGQYVELEDVHWITEPPQADEPVAIQQRHREPPRATTVSIDGQGRVRAQLLEAQLRGAPGQAAVVYRGNEVLGGGTIATRALASPATLPIVAAHP